MPTVIGLIFILVSFLLPIALIGGIVAAVVAARRRQSERSEQPDDPGIGSVRRFFLYGVGFAALVFAAIGLALLVSAALDAVGSVALTESDTRLAVALAFSVVGTPTWLLLAMAAQRTVDRDPVERRSEGRRLYLNAARGVALAVVLVSVIQGSRWLLGVSDFEGGPWGWALLWLGVWIVHDRVVATEPAQTPETRLLDRLYLYAATLVGLYTLLAGAFMSLSAPLGAAYDETFTAGLVESKWGDEFRTGLALLVAGAAVWSWHWLRQLVHREAFTTLWRVQVFLFGILSGVALALTAGAVLLHSVLQWVIGQPDAADAAEHFSSLPTAATLLGLGLVLWGYHRSVLVEATSGAPEIEPSDPERIYRYVMAAAGLVTGTAGLVALLALVGDAAPLEGSTLLRGSGWWRNQLVVGVTLLAMGLPVWGWYWSRIQRTARRSVTEPATLSRRVFLFAIFGVAVLTLLINLTIALFNVFQSALDQSLSLDVVRDTRWSLALIVTAGVEAMYHWLVLREDRRLQPERPAPVRVQRRDIVVLGSGPMETAVAEIRRVDGVQVTVWRPIDDGSGDLQRLSSGQLAALREELAASPPGLVFVRLDRDGFEVVPYQIEDDFPITV